MSPLKARSELAKLGRFAATGSNGGGAPGRGGVGAAALAFGPGGSSTLAPVGELGTRSAGIDAPAGVFGSKKPSGFGRLAITSMLRAASPALWKPAFRPTRGSVEDVDRSCARPAASETSTMIDAHDSLATRGNTPRREVIVAAP